MKVIELSEAEWRIVHNALAIYQCSFRHQHERQNIQRIMDTVRDEAISVILKSEVKADGRNSG